VLDGVDYITGMMASKTEVIDHPSDVSYGWNSKKGTKGIIKKVDYLCVIALAIVVDYVIVTFSGKLGFQMPGTAFFRLLVTIWYLLNRKCWTDRCKCTGMAAKVHSRAMGQD